MPLRSGRRCVTPGSTVRPVADPARARTCSGLRRVAVGACGRNERSASSGAHGRRPHASCRAVRGCAGQGRRALGGGVRRTGHRRDPAGLTEALAVRPEAQAMFENFTSQNRLPYWNVGAAKRQETRTRRTSSTSICRSWQDVRPAAQTLRSGLGDRVDDASGLGPGELDRRPWLGRPSREAPPRRPCVNPPPVPALESARGFTRRVTRILELIGADHKLVQASKRIQLSPAQTGVDWLLTDVGRTVGPGRPGFDRGMARYTYMYVVGYCELPLRVTGDGSRR